MYTRLLFCIYCSNILKVGIQYMPESKPIPSELFVNKHLCDWAAFQCTFK